MFLLSVIFDSVYIFAYMTRIWRLRREKHLNFIMWPKLSKNIHFGAVADISMAKN